MKIACLVDGEHYIPNIKDTLDQLSVNYDIRCAIFIGGTEKIGSKVDIACEIGYDVKFAEKDDKPDPEMVGNFAKDCGAAVVLDLSDEPVVNYDVRMAIACEVLGRELVYRGADFEFTPMRFKDLLNKRSISIWGTGKRIGKTAIGGFVGRVLKEHGFKPGIVTLSRGGPNKPEILRGDQIQLKPEFFLDMQSKGFHAASDNFEDALTSRVITFGCKRMGGGFSGKPFSTIIEQGAKMADEHPDVETIVLEGSGATFPEIKTDKVILLIGAQQPASHVLGFFGPYRIKLADLVIMAMCEQPMADREKVDYLYREIKKINPKCRVVQSIFRPKPLGDIEGMRVIFATTAPPAVIDKLVKYLEENYKCAVSGVSTHLSNKPLLGKDIERYIDSADVFLTELKAGAVSVVTKTAIERGMDVVYCDNIPEIVGGDGDDLEREILDLMGN